MIGLGTILNVAGIIVGGLFGFFVGNKLSERIQDTLNMACGISVLFIGLTGALEGMITLSDGKIISQNGMFVVISLALGGLIGEIIDIENGFERFGAWLKYKSGNSKDNLFIDGFVTTSLTVCIGAMAIIGSIQDGILGDYSILATKAILDLIIVMVMTCSLGKGCIFSAIPVGLFQGSVTLLATFIKPFMTELALFNISMVGSILIFCVGLNLVWGKKVRVANLLPSIIIAIIMTFFPLGIF